VSTERAAREVSEQAIKGASRCPRRLACLRNGDAPLCVVERCVGGKYLFVETPEGCECPYRVSFGLSSQVCVCPVRNELYGQSGQ
jgi:hypothetical protein